MFSKEEKTISVGFLRKGNSSEQNIYRNRRLKIHFQRCCASQKQNTKAISGKLKLNRYVLKIFQLFYNINGVQ
jgi:hypothetical protein